jgi:putative membrane protein
MATKALEYLPKPVRKFLRRNERSAWKGLLAGAAGGLAGTIVMTQFQNAWQKAAEKKRSGDMRGGESGESVRASEEKEEKEDATMKAASKLARAAGRELTPEQKRQASPWVHYGFGTAMGGLWGMAMETSPRGVRAQRVPFFGSLFGSALFLGADEMAVPALGLAEASESPSSHLYGWASHLVYGVTAEFVRRQIRSRI